MDSVSLPQVEDYRQLLLSRTPMIDVRAPVEFLTGALPCAKNLPLMVDEERHAVGICYKRQGQQAAIDLGHKLVCGDIKQQRVTAWRRFMEHNPTAVLYCARGGLRSQLSQQWLAEEGINCPRVVGGYKSLRSFLYNYQLDCCTNRKFILISGMTGTGKTEIIHQLPNAIDLEGAANHKGSSFGRPLDRQPCQIDFENQVSLGLLRLEAEQFGVTVVLEDESRMIGSCHLPHYLMDAMKQSPIVVVDMQIEERIERLWQEYVVARYRQTASLFPDQGDELFAEHLKNSLFRVRKRLGGQCYKEIDQLLDRALAVQHQDAFSCHRGWLDRLTREYYDPMYLYQLEKRKEQILFRGQHREVTEWLASYHS